MHTIYGNEDHENFMVIKHPALGNISYCKTVEIHSKPIRIHQHFLWPTTIQPVMYNLWRKSSTSWFLCAKTSVFSRIRKLNHMPKISQFLINAYLLDALFYFGEASFKRHGNDKIVDLCLLKGIRPLLSWS